MKSVWSLGNTSVSWEHEIPVKQMCLHIITCFHKVAFLPFFFHFFKCQKMLKTKEMPYYNLQQSFLQGKHSLFTVQFLLQTKLKLVNNENINKPSVHVFLWDYSIFRHPNLIYFNSNFATRTASEIKLFLSPSCSGWFLSYLFCHYLVSLGNYVKVQKDEKDWLYMIILLWYTGTEKLKLVSIEKYIQSCCKSFHNNKVAG